jgi:hypothetical protein
MFSLEEPHKIVILSEAAAPRSEAAAQSNDPYTPNPPHCVKAFSPSLCGAGTPLPLTLIFSDRPRAT